MRPTYESLLRIAVWGEPADTADQRVGDWTDYLEQYRAHHTRLQFTRELLAGIASHFGSRLVSLQPTSFATHALSLTMAVMFTPLLTDAVTDPSLLVPLNICVAVGFFTMFSAMRQREPTTERTVTNMADAPCRARSPQADARTDRAQPTEQAW